MAGNIFRECSLNVRATMSNDELSNLLDEMESSSGPDTPEDETYAEVVESEVIETSEVSDEESSMTSDDDFASFESESGVSQAEVYENLKRIGELEDEKQKIQDELRQRTEQLRSVLKHIDRSSILYKMLQSALADSAPAGQSKKATSKTAAKTPPKKPAKRKSRRK